jgi:hypothetical protein
MTVRNLGKLLVVALSLAPGAGSAHHSVAAEFDTSLTGELEGEITRVWFANPHIRYQLTVTAEDGSTTEWELQAGNVTNLARINWTEESLVVGDRVAVAGSLGRNGAMKLAIREIFDGGRQIYPPQNVARRDRQTITANLLRNLWAYAVIFCGHFPDGAEKFTREHYENETHDEWYLRQMLGSANFKAGPAMAFLSGNLSYQIEHHLFPDLPSNRYAEISEKVRPLCDKYGIPYTPGPLYRQYGQALRTITKLSLPNRFTKPNRRDYPETPEVPRGRRSDDERPIRRTETGGWTSKASA